MLMPESSAFHKITLMVTQSIRGSLESGPYSVILPAYSYLTGYIVPHRRQSLGMVSHSAVCWIYVDTAKAPSLGKLCYPATKRRGCGTTRSMKQVMMEEKLPKKM